MGTEPKSIGPIREEEISGLEYEAEPNTKVGCRKREPEEKVTKAGITLACVKDLKQPDVIRNQQAEAERLGRRKPVSTAEGLA